MLYKGVPASSSTRFIFHHLYTGLKISVSHNCIFSVIPAAHTLLTMKFSAYLLLTCAALWIVAAQKNSELTIVSSVKPSRGCRNTWCCRDKCSLRYSLHVSQSRPFSTRPSCFRGCQEQLAICQEACESLSKYREAISSATCLCEIRRGQDIASDCKRECTSAFRNCQIGCTRISCPFFSFTNATFERVYSGICYQLCRASSSNTELVPTCAWNSSSE